MKILSILPLLALATSACGPQDTDDTDVAENGQTAAAGLTADGQRVWNAYVAKTEAEAPLQEGCKPRQFSPPPGVPIRGVVILLHGFTACPQQYLELQEELTRQGLQVLLPLLPGHGREPARVDGKLVDHLEGLPVEGTWNRYADFARELGGIAERAHGVKMIGGLSLGSTVAASAVVQAPHTFTRALLFTPFIELPAPMHQFMMAADAISPNRRIGWGSGCVDERSRKNPRAGLCDFLVTNLRAIERFGADVTAQADQISIPVQFAGVEGDAAASNGAIKMLASKPRAAATCFFQKGVNHSILSKFDSPNENKFWLPSVFAAATSFIVDGKHFEEAGASSEKPFPRCKL